MSSPETGILGTAAGADAATPPLDNQESEAKARADHAILRTVTYASLFQFPLRLAQLHRALMGVSLDPLSLRQRLAAPFLQERLTLSEGFVYPRGRRDWLELRRAREKHTRRLLDRHRFFLERLASFPFVRLVALSGACAHDNATDADVDVFLIVKRNRAWSVALALMILSKWAGVRRTLCLNYILDEAALALPENDLFTAAEIVGMRPLAGRDAYRHFVQANAWGSRLFPNFFSVYHGHSEPTPPAGSPRLESLLERGAVQLLEAFSRRVLGAYLHRKMSGQPGVVLSPHRLKLHSRDHRAELNVSFTRALREALRAGPLSGAKA